jgi:hypothetical protein
MSPQAGSKREPGHDVLLACAHSAGTAPRLRDDGTNASATAQRAPLKVLQQARIEYALDGSAAEHGLLDVRAAAAGGLDRSTHLHALAPHLLTSKGEGMRHTSIAAYITVEGSEGCTSPAKARRAPARACATRRT